MINGAVLAVPGYDLNPGIIRCEPTLGPTLNREKL